MTIPEERDFLFISYSHKDSPRVNKYINALKGDDFAVWYDEDIHLSTWGASIEKALDGASIIILFITPDSLSSTNVFNEISFADNAKKDIYCVYLTDTEISDYPGWRLMLTKCQSFYEYRDGFDATYTRLKKSLIDVLNINEPKTSTVSSSKTTPMNTAPASISKAEKLKKAKVLCIQKKFDEAKKIYDEIIEADILDMDGYIGHIRVFSENYKKYDGAEIDEAIQIARDICGRDTLVGFDPDYDKYAAKRKEAENEKFNVGNIITFGNYWQSTKKSEGKTPIEWIVLKREGSKALLISNYCLDCKQFNTDYINSTWEKCNVRKWLNLKFINEAFSLSEQKIILDTTISNPGNAEYETSGGEDTVDKIFLLSIDEAENLLNKEERQVKCTDYAKARGAWTDDVTGTPYWWLRSPGGDPLLAAAVHYRGKLFIGGLNICVADTAIRPALWIDFDLD